MELSPEENRIQEEALQFARKNKKDIARRFTDPAVFLQEENPVSVFMAGSPGAGKTEASKSLLSAFAEDGKKILRIDADDLRSEFSEYNGENSWLFQNAVSVLVERIHDMALQQQQSFILDATLSNYRIAESNISRSLKRGKYYMYTKNLILPGTL